MAASIQIPTTFTANDKFTRVVSKMTQGVKKFSKSSGAAIKRLDNKINNSFRRIGKVGALVGGLTIASLFGAAIQGNIQFNDSLASVSAITGATGRDLADLEKLAKSTAKETKKSGAEVLKAYELVGSAKPELLEDAEALDGVTRSVITLSKASRMDLEQSTKALTDVMNQFNLAGSESGKTIDILAAGAKYGAATIPQISEAIVQFGTVAKQSNVSLMESVAAVEVFASKGIKGAEAGTKMRNVLTTLATAKALPKNALKELAKFGVNLDIVTDNTLPLNTRLKEMSKISGDATAMVNVFGKENQGAGAILLNNIDALDALTTKVGENGVAQAQASTNTNTLAFAFQAMKTAFTNTTTATNSNNKALDVFKDALFWVGDNMDKVLVFVGLLIGVFVVWKAIVIATKIATVAYKIAMVASSIATKAWAGAQWLLNAALTANPIGLVIAAIVALVGLVIWAIAKYDDWGAALLLFTGPLGMIINLFQSFRRNWDSIVQAFKTGGILGALKRIGAVILDSLLYPIQQLLSLIAKIPGMGGIAGSLNDKIDAFRTKLGVNDPLPSTTQASNENVSKSVSESNSNVRLDIVDKSGNVGGVQNDNNIPITLGPTAAAF